MEFWKFIDRKMCKFIHRQILGIWNETIDFSEFGIFHHKQKMLVENFDDMNWHFLQPWLPSLGFFCSWKNQEKVLA